MWISLYLPWKTFLKMIAELTPCAKAVSTALLMSHNLPSSSFQLKVKHFFFPSYQATGELPLQASVVTFLSFPSLSPNIVPNVELSVPIWKPNATMEHHKATSCEGKCEQGSSFASIRANLLKKSITSSHVHSTENKWRLTRGEEIKKSCSPIFAGSLHSPWKGKLIEYHHSMASYMW